MSEYLILIYGEEAEYDLDDEQLAEIMRGHEKFAKLHGDVLRGGKALRPPSTARTVRNGGPGGPLVTDGPFAEAKEGLGGYYLVEAPDLDAAVAIARDIPTVNGGVEVRGIEVMT